MASGGCDCVFEGAGVGEFEDVVGSWGWDFAFFLGVSLGYGDGVRRERNLRSQRLRWVVDGIFLLVRVRA